VTNDICTDEF
jgi:hypothetical protein